MAVPLEWQSVTGSRHPARTGEPCGVAGHPRDLTDLPLQLTYRTGRDDLVRGFFVPCLETAVLYRRAAGYFTSAGLALAARGVASLALRRGHLRLVVSPHLEPDDCAALERARDTPAAVLRTIAARSLAEIEDALLKDRLNALAWLAAAGLLEIKLALRVTAQGSYARGLFHAKTGVFSDDTGHHVSFSGSANETAGGLVENFEHLDVFRWTCSVGAASGRDGASRDRDHRRSPQHRVAATGRFDRVAV